MIVSPFARPTRNASCDRRAPDAAASRSSHSGIEEAQRNALFDWTKLVLGPSTDGMIGERAELGDRSA